MFNPSPQQLAIGDAVASGTHNILVDAKAGSGKTTTSVWAMSRIRRNPSALLAPSVVFLAFNKSIADTLASRVPRGTQASTFHSLGFRALKTSGLVERNVKVDGRKCAKLVWNAVGYDDPDTKDILRLVSVLKGQPTEQSEAETNVLIKHFDFTFEDSRRAVHVATEVLKKSSEDLSSIDFDDMLYLPILHDLAFDKMDWVFVDEAQDLNLIQHEIVFRLMSFSSRLVAVGDPHQAIYGFRGASSDSMSLLSSRFSCTTYPLSVSYRCSKAVVREAQRFLKWYSKK